MLHSPRLQHNVEHNAVQLWWCKLCGAGAAHCESCTLRLQEIESSLPLSALLIAYRYIWLTKLHPALPLPYVGAPEHTLR